MNRTLLEERIGRLQPEKRDLLIRRLRDREAAAGRSLPELVPDPGSRFLPFPLAEIQKVYWIGRRGLYDLSGVGSNAYLELELTGFDRARLPRLAAAFRRLVERHDNLRTVFLPDGRQQVLRRTPPYRFPVSDLTGLAPAAAERAVEAVRRRLRYGRRPLARWPLFEFWGHLLAGDRLRLTLSVETALVDGSSRKVFFGDLFSFYSEPDRRPPPPEVTYRDYVVTWERFQRGELYGASRLWWLERIRELPPPPALPLTCDPAPDTAARLVNRQGRALDPSAWNRLRELAAGYRLTVSAALVTAFAATLRGAGAGDAFTFAMVGTERPPLHPAMDQVLGNFNRVTLVSVGPDDGNFAEAADRLQRQLRLALDHGAFTGSEVLRELGRRHPSQRPLCPVAFNSLIELNAGRGDTAGPPPARPDFGVELVDAGIYVPQLLLLMTVDQFQDALHCRSQAAEDLFPAGFSAALYDAYRDLLERLATEDGAWEAPFARAAAAEDAAALARSAAYSVGGRWPPRPEAAATGPRPPRDDVERWLTAAWEDLLGRPPGGVDDDFFALGGDSFSLARLASRIEERWGPGLALASFFDHPTVSRLAALVRAGGSP